MTTEPSPDLRARTLRAALSRRPPARPAPGFARPYAALVAMLDALVGGLDDAEWEARAAGDWDARDLVVHLTATDGLLGEAMEGGASTMDELLARTEDAVGRRPAPADARRTWRRQADALCDRLAETDADRRVEVGGFPMRVRHHLTARAAETWIHADDIARATGRSLPPPPAEHLHPIADLSARSLPRALALTGRDHPDGLLCLILDGPGGGRWTLPLSRDAVDARPSVQVRMDVVEFCFLAGGRRDPADVRAETSGDPAVARDVLAAAGVFAGP
ncbi:maleylpyruvate isomerase family mycothiol-dependent enzyme [Actinomadura decatromicini]|uniref:Maleylpyruvate isomerase family mycothiol-dependent enzyme n=1 Tax=Actinomadura decatromicini TaxID=2604572 RepID=A0A5D3FNM1_9ACTN|nr:maleylpyruvate isomerase family mycothiol-dependent enzyme [Actinomadura decatromicini]TYK49526.1 maleylpyruvate isomerase family mycothiol-dependent enzyme [Actinomadura decatromicini]